MPESELRNAIEHWLISLERENASVHTIKNYRVDLEQFFAYFSRNEEGPPAPESLRHHAMANLSMAATII